MMTGNFEFWNFGGFYFQIDGANFETPSEVIEDVKVESQIPVRDEVATSFGERGYKAGPKMQVGFLPKSISIDMFSTHLGWREPQKGMYGSVKENVSWCVAVAY